MAEWKEYNGSDEQIAEINASALKNGYCFMYKNGLITPVLLVTIEDYSRDRISDLSPTHYLICAPHPYADMIKQLADTGQPVYWGLKGSRKLENWSCEFIPWHKHDIYEFRFTPFKD